jgi:DNA-binding transcriptional LysR family regulator
VLSNSWLGCDTGPETDRWFVPRIEKPSYPYSGGPRILIKRDDATGLAMGGNKARHYEFELAHLVEEGYDIALRVGNLQDSDLVARTIGEFSLSVIASPGYLEAKEEPKHPRDLVKHNCLINTLARSPRRWRFLQGTREFTVKVDGKYEVNDDLALRHFAGSGLGIAYLPSYFVHDRVNNGELMLLLQRFALEPLPISLIYPSRQWLTPAKRALVEHLIKGAQPRVFAETPAGYRHGRC